MSLTIERATVDAWERVRALRLSALAGAPDAFATTLAEDEVRAPRSWRERLEDPTVATFLGRCAGRDAGLVVTAPWRGRPGCAGLFSMWVEPQARGRGLGGLLVDAVVGHARDQGLERIVLEVTDGNEAAERLYAAKGFERTGVTGSLPPPRSAIREHQRELLL